MQKNIVTNNLNELVCNILDVFKLDSESVKENEPEVIVMAEELIIEWYNKQKYEKNNILD